MCIRTCSPELSLLSDAISTMSCNCGLAEAQTQLKRNSPIRLIHVRDIFVCLFDLILYFPVNNLSVTSERIFME